ncbi:MAG: sulfatase-like hydrolase/transferase [Verrucomicrobiae bacterium]|nr:sulfatase-like hydrolase/transferase [Verrucomicrobiae bacterium]
MKTLPSLFAGLTLLSGFFVTAFAKEKPNILFLFADDLGIGDLGCYQAGSKVPTPNLDRLASEGLRFTEAYCPVSVCSPTRYAFLTGRYPWRSWKKNGVLANWDKPMIDDGIATVPSLLHEAGYHTAGFGKWHLGANYTTVDGKKPLGLGKFKSPETGANLDLSAPITGGPLDRGFDRWFGFICASEQLVFEGNRAVGVLGHDLYKPPPAQGVDQLTVWPLADYLPEITRRSIAFLDEQKDAEAPFFLYFAPYVPHIPLAVENSFLGSTEAGEYGDYVHELDHYVGQVLEALDRNGLAETTLVIFASDNGSQFPESGAGHHPNAPYAGTKWTIREGGVRTPLIVRWPGRVDAGSTTDALCGLNDWLATFAELLGKPQPDSAIDSRSLLAVLGDDTSATVRESLALRSSGGLSALRRGKWKYIEGPGDGRGKPKNETGTQLYDLESDPRETNNVRDAHPDTVASMKAELERLLAKP